MEMDVHTPASASLIFYSTTVVFISVLLVATVLQIHHSSVHKPELAATEQQLSTVKPRWWAEKVTPPTFLHGRVYSQRTLETFILVSKKQQTHVLMLILIISEFTIMILLFMSIVLHSILVSGNGTKYLTFEHCFVNSILCVFVCYFRFPMIICSYFSRLLSQWPSAPESSWHLPSTWREGQNQLFTQYSKLQPNLLVQEV